MNDANKTELTTLFNNANAFNGARIVAGLRLQIDVLTGKKAGFLSQGNTAGAARIQQSIDRFVVALDALTAF
jgi:hypothetical protein